MSSPRLLLLGNCQMQSLAAAGALRDAPSKTYILFLHALSDIPLAEIRQDVERHVPAEEFAYARRQGNFVPMPAASDLQGFGSGAVVMNLFHEKPGHRHRTLGYHVATDGSLDNECPNLAAYLRESFVPLVPASGYFTRMERLVHQVAELFPGRPLVLVRRLSPHRSAGAEVPHASFLEGWEGLAPRAEAFYRRLERDLPNLRLVDMDRVVAGMLHNGAAWTDLFSGMLLHQGPSGLDIQVDIEHLTPEVWERTAELVREAACGRAPSYRPEEDPRRLPPAPARFQVPDADQVERDIASGQRYIQRRGLICALLALPRDHVDLLHKHAPRLDLNICDIDLIAAFLRRRGRQDAAALELLAALHANIAARRAENEYTRQVLTRHLASVLAQFRPIPRPRAACAQAT